MSYSYYVFYTQSPTYCPQYNDMPHTGELGKNGWTCHDAALRLNHACQRNHALDGVQMRHRKGQFGGYPAH